MTLAEKAGTQKKVTFTFVFNDGGKRVVCDVVHAKEENHLFWMLQEDGNVVAVSLYNVRYFSYKDPFDDEKNNVSKRARYDRDREYQQWKGLAEDIKKQMG